MRSNMGSPAVDQAHNARKDRKAAKAQSEVNKICQPKSPVRSILAKIARNGVKVPFASGGMRVKAA